MANCWVGLVCLAGSFAAASQAAESVAPYVQTVTEDVALIMDLAQVGPGDYLIDLGSGDGRFVIAAAQRGALAHGVELNPELVALARNNAQQAGVTRQTAFVQGDIFSADIRAASVVTIYLFPEANIQLRPKLLAELRPGTRLVSNSFHMGEWQPDGRAQGRTSGGALLWVIPADVSGQWILNMGADELRFALEQTYQQVSPITPAPHREFSLPSIRLRGTSIRIAARIKNRAYVLHGQVDGDKMQGVAHQQSTESASLHRWHARRINSAP